MNKITEFMKRLYLKGVSAVNPSTIVRNSLLLRDNTLVVNNKEYPILPEKCYIIGFGKAVWAMARSAELILSDYVKQGILIVPEGSSVEEEKRCSVLKVFEGGRNNLIDENSVNATDEILKLVAPLNESDLVLVMISGGGSALLAKPKEGVSISDKLEVTKLLQNAGADIKEINCVRRQLSLVKGGKLLDFIYPAKAVSLILSDVVGDPLEFIASGPTTKPTEKCNGWKIISKYHLEKLIPSQVTSKLEKVDSDSSEFDEIIQNVIVGNNTLALDSMKIEAIEEKYSALVMSSTIEGDVDAVAQKYSKLACLICKHMYREMDARDLERALATVLHGSQFKEAQRKELLEVLKSGAKKVCLLFGGETTVEVTGNGVGGRSQALSLSFSIFIDNLREKNSILCEFDIALLACGSDGIDGPTDAAGAVAYGGQTELAAKQGLNPKEFMNRCDSYNYYSLLNNSEDIIKVGHTGTNVMDLHILIVQPKCSK